MDLSRTFGQAGAFGNAASYSSAVYERCVSTVQKSLSQKQGKGSVCGSKLRSLVTLYSQLFDSSPTQQLAYHTIIGQVSRHRLAWHTKSGTVLDDVPVPTWWYRFVQDAVRSILLTGCAFYRLATRQNMIVPEVADPCMVLPQWNKRSRVWQSDVPGWTGIFFEPPINEWHNGNENAHVVLRCAASRGLKATLRLIALQDNWAARDGSNSKASVFTTVTSELTGQNGSERQWFKNLANPDVLQTRAVDIDSNFSTLVHKRADTIMKLDAQSHLMREKSASRSQQSDGDNEPAQMHREHMITDGRSYTEARPLSSLPDTKIIMDELMHSVFFAFGVPPQCLGKNINSERLASSNRLTEMAINSFQILIENMRRQLQAPIKDATESSKGSYLGFGLVLDEHELNQLLPVLNTKDAATMIARTFRIPEKMIDAKRVAEQQLVDPETGKKPRTEEQAIVASRQKANRPDA